jgi:IS30 family transposase
VHEQHEISFKAKTIFANSHNSKKRDSNETMNRVILQYFPKDTASQTNTPPRPCSRRTPN